MGPVANGMQYEKVVGYLATARGRGRDGRLRRRGRRGPRGLLRPADGAAGSSPPTRSFREEVFGPVLAATTFTDEDEAVKLANDTPYGLAGAVWTKDVHRAHRVAARIKAGTVWINAYRVVAPSVPVRRLQGLRARPRERCRGGRRLPREQVGVGRADRRHPRPVHAGLRSAMDFAEARETFFRPRDGAAAPAIDTPALRLRHVLEPLAMVSVWGAPAHEHLAEGRAGLPHRLRRRARPACSATRRPGSSPRRSRCSSRASSASSGGRRGRRCSVEDLLRGPGARAAARDCARARGHRRRRDRAGHAGAARGPRRRRARRPRRPAALRRAARPPLARRTRTPRSSTSRRSTASTAATPTSAPARRPASTGSRRTSSPSSGWGSTSTSTPAPAAGRRRRWTPRSPGSPPAAGSPTAR